MFMCYRKSDMVFLPVALSFFEKDTQFQTNQRALNYRSTKAPE